MPPLRHDLVLDHPVLDEQHEKIVALIEEFRLAVHDQTLDVPKLRAFLDGIHEYAVTHFQDEEAFMRAIHYPAREAHREAHLRFWVRLVHLMEACAEGGYDVACGDMIYAEVGAWLADHIHTEDTALAAWARVVGNTTPRLSD